MVATGWGVSCKNLNSSSSFSCTGYQYSGLAQQGMSLVPHGGEIIAAAVCYIKNISQKLIFFFFILGLFWHWNYTVQCWCFSLHNTPSVAIKETKVISNLTDRLVYIIYI